MGAILGLWVAAAMTLFMFSFLYKDNPFYRIGENLFVGVTIGYSITILYFESWLPKVWRVIHPEAGVWFENSEWWVLVFPVTLGLLVLTRFIPKYAWLSRWTFAFIVGYASGMAIPATLTTSVQKQAAGTVQPLITRTRDEVAEAKLAEEAEKKSAEISAKSPGSDEARDARVRAEELRERADAAKATAAAPLAAKNKAVGAEKKAEDSEKAAQEVEKRGEETEEAKGARKVANDARQAAITARIGAWDAASRSEYMLLTFYRDISALILFIGVLSVLVYFFFSIEHKGPVSVISRLGIWFLMVYFGASYGYTVMGRLSLLYGRLTTLKDASMPAAWFATPILILLMIGFLTFLHFRNKGQEPQA